VLLVCRALQGLGGAAAPVVARAMIRDTQPSAEAARLLSTMLAVLAVAPMIAPSVGSILLDLLGWGAIFATLAGWGTALFTLAHLTLRETLAVEHRVPVASPRGLARAVATFFSTPGTRLPTLIGCAAFVGQFAYIADAPFVFIQGNGVSTRAFA